MSIERERLSHDGASWKRWGPYLAERAWGTVREDYCPAARPGTTSRTTTPARAPTAGARTACSASATTSSASASRSRCGTGATRSSRSASSASPAPEGNHGEDVKEYYFYLDCTPTHSYMRALYKYPQRAFPYDAARRREPPARQARARVRADRHRRLRRGPLLRRRRRVRQGGARRHLIRISAANRGPEPAPLHLLPTLWFRNTWSWGRDDRRPIARAAMPGGALPAIHARHHALGDYCALLPRAPTSCSSPRTRPTRARLCGGANPHAVRQGRLPRRYRRARRATTR